MGQPLTIKKIIEFIRRDIWHIRLNELPRKKSFLIRQLRVIILAFRGFDEDKCALKASALTFFSLLSLVPAAAMGFGVAKGFGLQNLLKKELFEKMKGQDDLRLQLMAYAGGPSLSSSLARRMSLSRALSVRSFLIENGVRSTRIDVRALGNKTTEEPVNRVDLNVAER